MSEEIKNTEAEEKAETSTESAPAEAPAEQPQAPAAAPAQQEHRSREGYSRPPRPDGRRPRFRSEDGDDKGEDFSRSEMSPRVPRFRKKVCRFCHDKNAVIDYKRVDILEDFITDRGKILPRRITGTCAKHQRAIAREIKRARIIALLPYVEK